MTIQSADPRVLVDDDGTTVFVTAPVAGHRLRARGEAYLAVDCLVGRCSTNVGGTTRQENSPTVDSVRGAGHAACECGTLSDHLVTGAARRRWHREHKARALCGLTEPAGQAAPVDPRAIA